MKLLPLSAAILLTGCAAQPHNIKGIYANESRFESLDCAAIDRELENIQAALVPLNGEQRKAATADVLWVSVGTFLFWPAYFGLLATDDHEPEIARLKGEQVTLANLKGLRCSAVTVPASQR